MCSDRDKPGVIVAIAEFDSWESAKVNDEQEVTQEGAENAPDGTTYRNLDVVGVVEMGAGGPSRGRGSQAATGSAERRARQSAR